MRPLAIFTVFLMAILSCTCTAQRATKTVKDIFNHELFDSGVISRLPLYDSLKNILVNNIDTIFNYLDSKGRGDFYNFFFIPGKGESSDKIGLETLPAAIAPKIEAICRQLGEERILGFDLTRNQILVNVVVKYSYDNETSAETQHSLSWNWSFSNSEELRKDTTLGSGWTYHIYTEKRRGR